MTAFRFAVRTLLKNPGFAAVAILTLGIAIGAATAVFSVIDGVLLRQPPFEALDRLVVVWETDRNSGTTREPASVPDFLDFRERSRQLSAVATFIATETNFVPAAGDPTRLAQLRVSHDFLPTLGVRPLVGRNFTPDEDRSGGPRVVLVSERLWAGVFGRDPNVLGRTLRLNDTPYTILGVVPADADFGILQVLSAADYSRSFADRGSRVRVDVWTPLQADPEDLPRATHPNFVIGRLAERAGVVTAQEELAGIAADLERTYPENDARGVFVEPLEDVIFGPVRPALLVLLGAVLLVLLVACVNIASLLLARGTVRAPEVAVRAALGAGVRHLARQFLAESLLLTAAAAMLGVVLAMAGLQLLLAMAPSDVPRLSAVAIDVRTLLLVIAAALLIGLAFALIPLVQARRIDLHAATQGSASRTGTSLGRRRAHAALVVAEIALAVVLAIVAGLLGRSFWQLQRVDPGFRTDRVLKAEYQLPASRYPRDFRIFPDWKEFHGFTDALLRRVAALPGVTAVAVAGNHPLDPGFTNSFVIIGREAEAQGWPEISVRRVTPGYFATVATALVRGRLLEASDAGAAPVAVINEAAVRRLFGSREPLGERIAFWGAQRTIVGIVADEKFHGLMAPAPIAVYIPLAQAPSANGAASLLVRADVALDVLAPAIRDAFRQLDPALAVFALEPLNETLARSIGRQRFTMTLITLFAALAVLLAAIGVYGVLSYTVSERTREIGIRMALGARPANIRRLVVGQGAGLMAAGVVVGLAAAWWAGRLLGTLLFAVTPTDLATFLFVPAGLALVALAASYVPASRALRVDPVRSLRME